MSASLTLATWNCRMGLARKRDALAALGADLIVVPEAAARVPPAGEPGVSHAWKGTWAPKGLGVYAFGGWTLEPIVDRPDLPWLLPLRLVDPAGQRVATVLAMWAVAGRRERRPSYAGQLTSVLDAWSDELAAGDAILLGDLNASTDDHRPAGRAHRANVERLHALGLRSAYHAHTGCAHGAETDMTLRWIGPGRQPLHYHCDFVFLPERWIGSIRRVEVGTMRSWVEPGLSDHAPVIVELGSLGESLAPSQA